MSWVSLKTFQKRICKETEKKRKISEKREFSLEKNLFSKILFSYKKFSFMNFSLYFPGENETNMKMEAFKVLELLQEFEEVEETSEVDKK